MDFVMIVLFALGVAVLAALIWVAFSAGDEQEARQRRIERDLDLKRGRRKFSFGPSGCYGGRFVAYVG